MVHNRLLWFSFHIAIFLQQEQWDIRSCQVLPYIMWVWKQDDIHKITFKIMKCRLLNYFSTFPQCRWTVSIPKTLIWCMIWFPSWSSELTTIAWKCMDCPEAAQHLQATSRHNPLILESHTTTFMKLSWLGRQQ